MINDFYTEHEIDLHAFGIFTDSNMRFEFIVGQPCQLLGEFESGLLMSPVSR